MGPILDAQENTLREIDQGDIVYDVIGKKIGKVKFVQMPSHMMEPHLEDFPYDSSKRDIPPEMVYRLLRTGFVAVDTGWFARDRLIPPDWVSSTAPGEVYLNTRGSQLIAA